jgi:hypothetical protein
MGMRKISFLRFGILICLLTTSSVSQKSGADPQLSADEISRLVNECGARTTQMAARLYDYSFIQTETNQTIDKAGLVKSEHSRVFEVYPITLNKRARTIYVLVSEDGVPLSSEKIASERERAAKQTQELEEQNKSSPEPTSSSPSKFWSYGIKVEKHGRLSKTFWFIRPTDFLLGYDFFAPRRVSLEGREALLLSFRPRAGYVYDKSNVPYPVGIEDYGRAMSQLGGRIWINEVDKVIVRIEASPLSEMSMSASATDLNPKTAFRYEFERLPNGTWVPRQSAYNSYGREDVFWKTPMSRTVTYRDFKLFKTTADVEKNELVPPSPQTEFLVFQRSKTNSLHYEQRPDSTLLANGLSARLNYPINPQSHPIFD